MELNINLNNQRDKKRSKRTLRIFSAITFSLSLAMLAMLVFNSDGSRVLLWFYLFYWILFSISLFMQSNGKHPIDLIGKSYFRLNDWGVEVKNDLFSRKGIKVAWADIEEMNIKLFEIDLRVADQWKTINLEKLSDDNLKTVKQCFQEYQLPTLEQETSMVN